MAISEEAFEAAKRRAVSRLKKTPVAVSAHYDRRTGRLLIELNTGLALSFKPRDAQGLEASHPDDLRSIQISPSGLGLHFPSLGVDIYLPALLEGFLGTKKWMASQMGQAGGRVSTEAKSKAARENGRLGGRPKKPANSLEPA